jgi:hypothetical protein
MDKIDESLRPSRLEKRAPASLGDDDLIDDDDDDDDDDSSPVYTRESSVIRADSKRPQSLPAPGQSRPGSSASSSARPPPSGKQKAPPPLSKDARGLDRTQSGNFFV